MSNVHWPTCRCIKSNCIQRYCMCFSSTSFCSVNCNCTECWNTEDNEDEVEEHADMIRKKQSGAFRSKIVSAQDATETDSQSSDEVVAQKKISDSVLGDEQRRRVKGCSCWKTKCTKLYCECFKNKVRCTAKCQCRECGNCFGTKESDSNIGPTQSITSDLTSEEALVENTMLYGDSWNSDPNKRPRYS